MKTSPADKQSSWDSTQAGIPELFIHIFIHCIKRGVASREREVIVPHLLGSREAPYGVMHPGLGLLVQEGRGALRAGAKEGH